MLPAHDSMLQQSIIGKGCMRGSCSPARLRCAKCSAHLRGQDLAHGPFLLVKLKPHQAPRTHISTQPLIHRLHEEGGEEATDIHHQGDGGDIFLQKMRTGRR